MQVLLGACSAAAGQVTTWAGELRAAKSNRMVPDTAAQLLDPATLSSITSPLDFADLWIGKRDDLKAVLDQLSPSTTGAQSSALVAVDYFLSVSSFCMWIIMACLLQPLKVLLPRSDSSFGNSRDKLWFLCNRRVQPCELAHAAQGALQLPQRRPAEHVIPNAGWGQLQGPGTSSA